MPFTFTPQAIPDVILIEPKVFPDDRGFFLESFKASDFSPETLAQRAKDEFDAEKSAEDQFSHNRIADQQA